ncbi:hypothetical protein PTKIN_Ptkin06aG0082500 [Pterospermum kingtungense]
MQSAKEAAANVAASAKSGLEKTKAVLEEKVEKATAHDPMQKDMATQRKEDRVRQAELEKQEARQHNAAAKQAGRDEGFTAAGSGAYAASGTHTYSKPTGAHQMSALPGHGTEQPVGHVMDGRAEACPIGTNKGVGGSKSHNTRVEGNPHGYGTGGTYT